MAFDVGAGLSSFGEATSKYVGVAALEQQKSALEEQKIKLADQMAGTRQEKQNQFELTRDEAKLQEEYRLKRQGISEDIDTAKKLGLIGGENAAAPPGEGSPVKGGDGKPNSNNIGNVREVGKTAFVQPASFEEGVNVAINNVRAYPKVFNDGKPMTLMQIAEHWAPKGDGDNDPKAWAFNAARYSGLDPEKPLDLNDPATAAAFARGAHAAEWGPKALKPVGDYATALENPPSKGTPSSGGAPAAAATGTSPMPPPIDPYRRAGLSLLPMLKPYGEAMTAADKAVSEDAWKRRNAAREDEKTAVQWKQNDLLPDGSPNLAKIAFNAAKTLDEEKNKARGHLEGILPPGAENMTPEELRKTLNPLLVRQADQLNAGTNFLSTMGQRPMGSSGPSRGELAAITEMLHPSFSADRNEQIRIFKQDYMAPGKPGNDQVQALANAGQHTAQLVDAYNAVHNSQLPVWNKWYQDLAAQKGWGPGVGFDAVKQAVATELAKVVANAKGAGAVSERDENQNILARWNSPEQMSEVIGNLGHLYTARRNTLAAQAKRVGLGKDYIDEAIGEDGVRALDSLPGLVNKNPSARPATPRSTGGSNLPPPPDGFTLLAP